MNKNEFLHPNQPDGIYRYEMPMIGGIPQYVQIRGTNKNNPVLLFLHGGPGGALSGVTHILHAGWEERFTVVNWDQRGAGRTAVYNRKRAAEIGKTGSMEDYVQDIGEVIAYLHTVLDFDKLILCGFSWGTMIGAEYAKQHPEELLCYVGIGQCVNYRDGVLCTCEKLLRIIPKDSADAKKVQKLIADMPENPKWDQKLMWSMRSFNPLCGKYIIKHAKRTPMLKILRSPLWNLHEKIRSTIPDSKALARSYRTMLEYDFRQNLHFSVPVLFVSGEEESVCPSELVQECMDMLTAPEKRVAIIPKAAHGCFFDQPEQFRQVLDEFLKFC